MFGKLSRRFQLGKEAITPLSGKRRSRRQVYNISSSTSRLFVSCQVKKSKGIWMEESTEQTKQRLISWKPSPPCISAGPEKWVALSSLGREESFPLQKAGSRGAADSSRKVPRCSTLHHCALFHPQVQTARRSDTHFIIHQTIRACTQQQGGKRVRDSKISSKHAPRIWTDLTAGEQLITSGFCVTADFYPGSSHTGILQVSFSDCMGTSSTPTCVP